MSKAGVFAKVLKLITTLFARGLKIAVVHLAHFMKELFKGLKKRLRFSITFKTAAIYTLIFSMVLLILSIALVSSFGLFLLYENRSSLIKSSGVVEGILGESPDNFTNAKNIEVELKKYADIEDIVITLFNRKQGITFTTADKPEGIAFTAVDNPDSFMFDGDRAGISKTSLTMEYIHVNTELKLSDDIYYVQVSRPLLEGKLYLAMLVAAVATGFVPAVLITTIIGARTLRKMLNPIDDMISTAKAVSARNLNTRLNVVDSHDELKELAETFNDMLDRIQDSYERQNRFVSDASHELRTPISVIQGYAGLLQRWGKEDKEVLDESVSAIKNEAENMRVLVERLLFLARADKNTQKIEKSFFSVNELVSEVIRETRLIDTEHSITGEITGTVSLHGDRGLIKQALRIFIDNSIRYTPAGGKITIDGRLKGGRVILTIEDNGIGISGEDLPHIFDRFYKSDKSRTRKGGGSGLGLSIAKWIIERHQGHILVESALNKGTKVSITLSAG